MRKKIWRIPFRPYHLTSTERKQLVSLLRKTICEAASGEPNRQANITVSCCNYLIEALEGAI